MRAVVYTIQKPTAGIYDANQVVSEYLLQNEKHIEAQDEVALDEVQKAGGEHQVL